jgi:hypothetical protein
VILKHAILPGSSAWQCLAAVLFMSVLLDSRMQQQQQHKRVESFDMSSVLCLLAMADTCSRGRSSSSSSSSDSALRPSGCLCALTRVLLCLVPLCRPS